MKENELLALISGDERIREILGIIASWQLPDSWLTAGTLRNLVWNHLSASETNYPSEDVDVAFFDPELSYEDSAELAEELAAGHSQFNWEIKNQAHMHRHNFADEAPFADSLDAVANYPETCTALACRMGANGGLDFQALYGIADLVTFQVRPTPKFASSPRHQEVFRQRVAKKKWAEKWPEIRISS